MTELRKKIRHFVTAAILECFSSNILIEILTMSYPWKAGLNLSRAGYIIFI